MINSPKLVFRLQSSVQVAKSALPSRNNLGPRLPQPTLVGSLSVLDGGPREMAIHHRGFPMIPWDIHRTFRRDIRGIYNLYIHIVHIFISFKKSCFAKVQQKKQLVTPTADVWGIDLDRYIPSCNSDFSVNFSHILSTFRRPINVLPSSNLNPAMEHIIHVLKTQSFPIHRWDFPRRGAIAPQRFGRCNLSSRDWTARCWRWGGLDWNLELWGKSPPFLEILSYLSRRYVSNLADNL